ncbi:MAG: phytase, partial [Pseudomonadota bacterium]
MKLTKRNQKIVPISLALALLSSCSMLEPREFMSYEDSNLVDALPAVGETVAVVSNDDAADDPAIWINSNSPEESLIFGTDKQSGIGIYRLDGSKHSFIEYGRPNNIDIRQQVDIGSGDKDFVAVSDRSDNTIGLFVFDENKLIPVAKFSSNVEPYGFCLGTTNGDFFAMVTYKSGLIEQYRITYSTDYEASKVASYQLPSQLEGCVMDDKSGDLFVGEEAQGVWLFSSASSQLASPELIVSVDDGNGMQADIEGVALYDDRLIISSQGNDSFAVYQRHQPYKFIKRFRVVSSGDIDAAQETDGIEATSQYLGDQYPNGLLVV